MDTGPSNMSQRELVVRVATLELLVADLVHVLRTIAPEAVDALAREAAHDQDVNDARAVPANAEHQRFRLHQVLAERLRALSRRRTRESDAARHSSACQ